MGIEETVAGWKVLRKLSATGIDLERLSLIRQMDAESLSDVEQVSSLIEKLGLNDEGLEEYPLALHPICGTGLRIWQYPIQFAPYLVDLGRLDVRSYLEVGVRHGGTFVTTVEYLQRFGRLDRAIGVDLLPCPGIVEYGRENRVARFVRMSTQSRNCRPRQKAIRARVSRPCERAYLPADYRSPRRDSGPHCALGNGAHGWIKFHHEPPAARQLRKYVPANGHIPAQVNDDRLIR